MEDVVERVTPGTESWDKYGAEHFQRYKFFESYYANKSVLDAACGTGYGSHFIAQSQAKSVLGIDISDEAIAFCNGHYKAANLQYRKFDCSKVNELPEKSELAISFETIEHLHDPEAFIKNMRDALVKGGTFICSTPNKDRSHGAGGHNPYHPSELEWEEFKVIFEKYFSIEAVYHQSETVEYLRIQEVKHLIHQAEARSNAFIWNRLELLVRKMVCKHFKPIPYYHTYLDDQRMEDIRIEPMTKKENWHKTFILVGKAKP